jgi:hypothetical protein
VAGYDDVDRYVGPLLSQLGFEPDGVDEAIQYGERPAWAVYYRGEDCKFQVCWSASEGGVDFMLSPLDAPNEFGLVNKSGQWHYVLALSGTNDGEMTPSLDATAGTWWAWREALLETHLGAARTALLANT